jgi:tartronate-semialdehyde synthase
VHHRPGAARVHKEDFQAVDITSIVKPVTKWATTVLEPGQVPYAFQKAFYEMRSGRPGPVLIDLPFDVQMAEIEFDIDAYEPLPLAKPTATRSGREGAGHAQRGRAPAAGGRWRHHQRRRQRSAGGVRRADRHPGDPDPDGLGHHPDDHPLMVGMVGLQTSHRYGNATMLKSDFVLGIGNRWANRHTGSVEVYTEGRKFIHVDIEPTQIGRVFTRTWASFPTPAALTCSSKSPANGKPPAS